MRAAALLPKARLKDPGVMPPGTVRTMATQNGARALGFENLGRLTPSGPADLLLIAADLPTPLTPHPSLDPDHSNLAEQLLLWRHPSDVKGVMCAGRWLLYNDEVIGVDEKALRARVVEAAAQLWQ